jgi:hypothetical protein
MFGLLLTAIALWVFGLGLQKIARLLWQWPLRSMWNSLITFGRKWRDLGWEEEPQTSTEEKTGGCQ